MDSIYEAVQITHSYETQTATREFEAVARAIYNCHARGKQHRARVSIHIHLLANSKSDLFQYSKRFLWIHAPAAAAEAATSRRLSFMMNVHHVLSFKMPAHSRAKAVRTMAPLPTMHLHRRQPTIPPTSKG